MCSSESIGTKRGSCGRSNITKWPPPGTMRRGPQVRRELPVEGPPMTERRALRVGIDVGGTFTDLVAAESWSGRVVTRKVASTPREPHRAVMQALLGLLREYEPRPAVEFLAHSTTIATNAILGQL